MYCMFIVISGFVVNIVIGASVSLGRYNKRTTIFYYEDEEIEARIRQQVQTALGLQSPEDREKILVDIIITERVAFNTAYRRAVALEIEMKHHESRQMKILYKQAIEDIEERFPQETDVDFEKKKVKWNKTLLDSKEGSDKNEERRRQKWLYYAENPPNDEMMNIINQATIRGLSKEELASGIAKAYRCLSDDIHENKDDIRGIEDPLKYFRSKTVVLSLRAVLEKSDILEEHLPKIPSEQEADENN